MHSKPFARKEEYWPVLGAAERFKEAVTRNPAFADAKLPAFTVKELDRERSHVR